MEWDFGGQDPLNVWAHECNDNNAQKWFFVGQQLKNRHDSRYCLDWDAGSINGGDGFNIYMRYCESGGLASQHWFKASLDPEAGGERQELTIAFTTCEGAYSESGDPFFLSVNDGADERLDYVGDKRAGQTDSYTAHYDGALNRIVLSAGENGADTWQICRIVLNGYLYWNKGDEQGGSDLWLTTVGEGNGHDSVDLLPYFSEHDTNTDPEPLTNPEGCTDSPEGWSEGADETKFDCEWYGRQLADPNFDCVDHDYVGTDGKSAAEACCACGGGSNGVGVPSRPPPVSTCSAGVDSCVAARDGDGRPYTYVVCPDSVEQHDVKYGDFYLLGSSAEVAEDGVVHYTNGSAEHCDGPRTITVSFACSMTEDYTMVVHEPEMCVFEGVMHHPCAC